jgi:transcriptional regulator with XRE-family HTH domain
MPEESQLNLRQSSFSGAENHAQSGSATETNLKSAENNEETIRRVLSNYHIGHKLRQLRAHKKIALVDLGRHTGLSASMLSQLENGKLVPTLPTLARIAIVFDVGLDFFFTDKKAYHVFSVIRAKERVKVPQELDSPVPGYNFEVLAFGAIDKSLSAYLGEFPKLEANDIHEHFHDGSEFVHVLQGSLAIRYQSEDHVLSAGDSVYFDAAEPHSYQGLSDPPAQAIVITTPARG